MPYKADMYYQAYHADDPIRKALVLIHGAGGDYLSWPTQIRRLSDYRVYTPDLPGHGKSRGHGLQRISAYGEQVLNWLNEVNLAGVYLSGHSMGGAIALWIAIHHPDKVKGLILMGTGASLPVNLSLIEELASPQGYPTAVDNICRWSFSPQTESKLVDNVRKQMLKNRPTVLQGDFRACDAYNLSDQLDRVQSPTLILVGDQDKMTPLRFSEELVEGIPGAELKVIPQAGHMVVLEKPGQVAEEMRGFLERVPL
ncbi:MAG: alpha/beta hydrolase [Anaerolineales bacterium]|nr:alpha/beta hydrolase [Anaerolineales bacterium]